MSLSRKFEKVDQNSVNAYIFVATINKILGNDHQFSNFIKINVHNIGTQMLIVKTYILYDVLVVFLPVKALEEVLIPLFGS